MKTGIECFAGANTSEGFTSGFEGIFACMRRTFFIKGAPGTGKSGLMKRIAQRQMALGHAVSVFYCSSDPDSVDGVVDETILAAIMDATSPHTYDPPLPGATGTILPLGDLLDEDRIAQDTPSIMRLNRDMKHAFYAAQSYLSAAKNIQNANASCEEEAYAHALSEKIVSELPILDGYGRARTFFLDAYTHKGRVSFLNQFSPRNVICVPAPFPKTIGLLLDSIAGKANARGLEAILFLSPIDPKIISHVYLPDVPLLITGEEVPGAAQMEYAPAREENHRPGDRALFDALTEKACSAMAEAKALHDELEAYYTPRMDFSRLIECEARVTTAFDRLM